MQEPTKAYQHRTVIEDVEVIYDESLVVGNCPTASVDMQILGESVVSSEREYAVADGVDRERARKAYPGASRASTLPMGEDLDIV